MRRPTYLNRRDYVETAPVGRARARQTYRWGYGIFQVFKGTVAAFWKKLGGASSYDGMSEMIGADLPRSREA